MTNRDPETGRFLPTLNVWKIETDKDGNEIYYCYANDELLFFTDDKRVMDHNWGKFADGYACSRINKEFVAVHRFISKPLDNELVDHINRNKKDNRKSNLRNTDKSINAFNAKMRSTNKSGITGVHWRKDTKKWEASIKKNYKKYTLGDYATKEEAMAARKAAERILYAD